MSDQVADTKPGNYYVTVRRDDGRAVCLAGPFRDNHAGALALVDRCRDLAVEYDPKTWFDSFGTMRAPYSYSQAGAFNGRLGL